MQMTCHYTPGMYFQVFVLLAISYTCQYYILILNSDEQVYPVGNGEGYKIKFVIISEFVFSAHQLKLLSFCFAKALK